MTQSASFALVNNRAICADIFDRPASLRAYWPSLVRSYALEADCAARAAVSSSTPLAAATRLLTAAADAPKQAFPSRGLGTDVRLAAPHVLGAALIHDETAVHVALFARNQRPDAAHVRRPSARARHLNA